MENSCFELLTIDGDTIKANWKSALLNQLEIKEAMRNIMRHNEEKEKKQRNVDNDFDEEDCSLQEILEAKFDELFGTAQIDEENS